MAPGKAFILSTSMDFFGDGLMTIFFPLIMLSITSDPIIFSLAYVLKTSASVLFSFLSGYLFDFYPVVKVTSIIRIIRLMALIMLILLPTQIELVLFCAFVFGATEVFIDNAIQTITLSLFPCAERVNINNRLQSMEYFFVFFVGPVIGSLLFSYHPTVVLYLSLAAYLFSMIFFLSVTSIPVLLRGARTTLAGEMTAGVTFLFSHPSLRALCLYAAAFCVIIAGLFAVLPLVIAGRSENPQLFTGLFYAINASGFVITSFLTPRLVDKFPVQKMLSYSLSLCLAASVLLVLNNSLTCLLAAMFLLGCGMGGWGCIAVTYRQRTIPEAVFSRANAVYRLVSWGALCLGGVLGGSLYRLNGETMLFMAALLFSLCITFSFRWVKICEE